MIHLIDLYLQLFGYQSSICSEAQDHEPLIIIFLSGEGCRTSIYIVTFAGPPANLKFATPTNNYVF